MSDTEFTEINTDAIDALHEMAELRDSLCRARKVIHSLVNERWLEKRRVMADEYLVSETLLLAKLNNAREAAERLFASRVGHLDERGPEDRIMPQER